MNLRSVVLMVNWCLFLLAFFEPPHWCREDDNTLYGDCKDRFTLFGTTADGIENEQLYPNTGMLLLTILQSKWIELYCVAFNSCYLLLKFADDGFISSLFFYKGFKRWSHLIQIMTIFCIIIGITSNNTILNPIFRMLLLATYLRRFQREFFAFIKMVSQYNIFSLLPCNAMYNSFYFRFLP